MHVANFPYNRNYPLYLFLVFGINLPWTLSCCRNYILVPTNDRELMFATAYDVLVSEPFIRNSLILQTFSAQGFLNAEFFTLMLMDGTFVACT